MSSARIRNELDASTEASQALFEEHGIVVWHDGIVNAMLEQDRRVEPGRFVEDRRRAARGCTRGNGRHGEDFPVSGYAQGHAPPE